MLQNSLIFVVLSSETAQLCKLGQMCLTNDATLDGFLDAFSPFWLYAFDI